MRGIMNNLSTSVNSSLEWHRSKVQELASQGYNQSEISRILHKPAYHEKVYVEQFLSSIEIFW
jgi:hypothetical protein